MNELISSDILVFLIVGNPSEANFYFDKQTKKTNSQRLQPLC